tara:strand:- start:292 stop:456 length:165 start_codon:yes stop_codon:yes gene_type:complete
MKTKKYKKKPQKKTKTRTSEKSSKTIKDRKIAGSLRLMKLSYRNKKTYHFGIIP